MKKITQAVILAGGAGIRLQPFTKYNPKPMILINGKPFLEHLIELLKENDIKEVIILTGYLKDKIEKYFGNGSKFGIKIRYSYTRYINEQGGENESGIRLINAQKLLKDYFLLLYCDNYYPLDLNKLIKFYNEKNCDVSAVVFSNLDRATENNMYVETDGLITNYDPGRKGSNLNGVDIGFFIVKKNVLELLPKGNSKFESEVLPKLIKKRRLAGYMTDQKYYSIGDFERVRTTAKFLANKKVIFLDRDGVINKRPPKADYVKDWKEFIFLPDTIAAIKLLKDKAYKIYLVSNQPGIARGKLTEKDLNLIHQKMQQELKKNGAEIDDIYYCPHGWDDGCSCRKPKPGMFYQASREHFLNLAKAVFIGDDKRDEQAGYAAGCKTILITNKRNLFKIAKSLINNRL